jgi:ribonuclease P protein component
MRAAPRAANASPSESARTATECVKRVERARALQSSDFARLLATRPRARTARFVLHHLFPLPQSASPELSTGESLIDGPGVDESRRLGLVVPKRHARRAVTRSLIKRQGRTLFAAAAARLDAGDWLLRLRAPFEIERFPSAASSALREAVRSELQTLFDAALAGRAAAGAAR